MQSVTVILEQPISQFVDYRSRERQTPPQQTILELVSLGFNALLHERYAAYHRSEISFGRLAQDLGLTTWELSHLLEERGWPAYNLPTNALSGSQVGLHDGPTDYNLGQISGATDESTAVK